MKFSMDYVWLTSYSNKVTATKVKIENVKGKNAIFGARVCAQRLPNWKIQNLFSRFVFNYRAIFRIYSTADSYTVLETKSQDVSRVEAVKRGLYKVFA